MAEQSELFAPSEENINRLKSVRKTQLSDSVLQIVGVFLSLITLSFAQFVLKQTPTPLPRTIRDRVRLEVRTTCDEREIASLLN